MDGDMSDNELIAEFMSDGNLIPYPGGIFPLEYGYYLYGLGWRNKKYLYFDSEWDWLMPVVEKISKLHDSSFEYDIDKIRNGDWPKDKEYMDVIALPLSTPIEAVYKAVVEFIKWYSTQESSKLV